MKILITGSEGLLGKLAQEALKKENHEIIRLDMNGDTSVDLRNYEKSLPFFKDVETVVHFTAHPRPWITRKESIENIKMTSKVLIACKTQGVKRVVYESSINVYDLERLYPNGKITKDTSTNGNSRKYWKAKPQELAVFYPLSKISCETLVNAYCTQNKINGINLRFGCITDDGYSHPIEKEDEAIWLGQNDFKEIIRRAICFNGLAGVACVSNNIDENGKRFVDLQPLVDLLDYHPKQNSKDYKR